MKRFSRTSALLLCAVALTACASLDRGLMTKLIPVAHEADADTFRYETYANVQYPLDSPRAETIRRQWLDEILAANGYGGKPYTITREAIAKPGAIGSGYELYYTVRIPK